nr:MAG: hypothetical protein [Skomarfal virus 48]
MHGCEESNCLRRPFRGRAAVIEGEAHEIDALRITIMRFLQALDIGNVIRDERAICIVGHDDEVNFPLVVRRCSLSRAKLVFALVIQAPLLGKRIFVPTNREKSSLVRAHLTTLEDPDSILIRVIQHDIVRGSNEKIGIRGRQAFRGLDEKPAKRDIRPVCLLANKSTNAITRDIDLVTNSHIVASALRRHAIHVVEMEGIAKAVMIQINLVSAMPHDFRLGYTHDNAFNASSERGHGLTLGGNLSDARSKPATLESRIDFAHLFRHAARDLNTRRSRRFWTTCRFRHVI